MHPIMKKRDNIVHNGWKVHQMLWMPPRIMIQDAKKNILHVVNTESTSGDEMQVMLEYLKSLQNYKKLCRPYFCSVGLEKCSAKESKENTKKR